ncbi:MAG TPA: hypothetical protein DDZ80_08805 [Cyanobacteria bacterium UBA8803]|nr:hypothetical protein [Cyanobacteria bacterium UBA9273]HBL58600.1 hypothetical protein [Cyanobacteria bacterium UBA8803]
MTIQTECQLTFTIPIPRSAHQLAERFCQYQANLPKAEQVYLNTLAVYAVNYYLQCLGFETDWPHSDSWNPMMQTFLNVADLAVKNCGKLECRPMLPEADMVYIPEEVWEERIGYIAVQLDDALQEATLLGFRATVSTQKCPVAELRSLDELPEYLSHFQQVQPVQEQVNLSQWLHNIFETGWETVAAIFTPPQSELAFSPRSLSSIATTVLEIPVNGVKRGKCIDLERDGQIEPLAVFVGITPSSSSKMDITVEVCPLGGQPYLPPDLQLMVLDERGKPVLQADAGNSESMEFQFSGELGESFSFKVVLGDASITENFLI